MSASSIPKRTPEIEEKWQIFCQQYPQLLNFVNYMRDKRLIGSHVAKFENRSVLLIDAVRKFYEVSDCNLAPLISTLSSDEKDLLATYLYQAIDESLAWDNVWGYKYAARPFKRYFIDLLYNDLNSLLPKDAVVLDVGSGAHPVSQSLLYNSPNRRIVAVDCATPDNPAQTSQILQVKLDINLILENANQAVCNAVETVSRFTGERNSVQHGLQFDLVVLADILNYVNPDILQKILPTIPKGGWIAVISNSDLYTSPSYLHNGQPFNPESLPAYLQSAGFAIRLQCLCGEEPSDKIIFAQRI